ncbi:hypothetical protein R1flu_006759 [Riccia fluitans]|uniref:Uncharacterized protein n=1 Tax=Riccia fluitans TaxID=41844 RepID=A0ABD1YX92_9MARC
MSYTLHGLPQTAAPMVVEKRESCCGCGDHNRGNLDLAHDEKKEEELGRIVEAVKTGLVKRRRRGGSGAV